MQATTSQATLELAGHDGYVSCCRFVDDSHILTTSGDSSCVLWDIEHKEMIAQFTDHSVDVMSVAVDPHTSKLFITGSCDSTAKLWDCRIAAYPVMTFHGHDSDINSVAYLPGGHGFGTGSDDSTCQIFDLRCCLCANKFKSGNVLCGISSVDFSLSGRIVFAGFRVLSWALNTFVYAFK